MARIASEQFWYIRTDIKSRKYGRVEKKTFRSVNGEEVILEFLFPYGKLKELFQRLSC